MRDVSCGIWSTDADSRSRRRTATKATMARIGPTRKATTAINMRIPMPVEGEIRAQGLGAHNPIWRLGDRSNLGRPWRQTRQKCRVCSPYGSRFECSKPVRTGRFFHRGYSEALAKHKPLISSLLTIVFVYSYSESKRGAWVLGDSFDPQNVPSVP